ncbi:auxin-responsive protein IAA27 [Ricinus communis]|uniref:Auxin-responsive protein n=1 Tax=Ricinus communis TaxID=3988 RepID=B9RKM2_RICCO|nr:auxin-responsive protein IAA27 [Ricinus communis]EEF48220.1 Auxin-responsive protein IAA27, putative [Ricinus communis]|eukprot:XP_002514266.1 auxin-responsive protein IAA27 [Ricinus communis]
MSMSLEHDYIGLTSEVPSMETKNSDDKNFSNNGLNMKATELRLGLPGSESPERENGLNNNSNKSFMSSGAKRGFSVAIHGGSGNWVFSATDGSEPGFSPRAANAGKVITASDSGHVKDGLPQSPKTVRQEKKNQVAPASKAQVVGWPPIRSFRKNTMGSQPPKNDDDDAEAKTGSGCLYIKVSMDGAPYLRKVDLKTYSSYMELSSGLEKMFSCFTIGQCGSHGVPSRDGLSESRLMDLLHGSEYVLTYEDKDGDWMLVGDVPWKMFTDTCRRLRIMKSSEAIGLAPRAMEKCKNRN